MNEFILEILKNIDGKKILGTKDKLSKSFEALSNELDLTHEDTINIQSQLIDEYETGKVKDEGLVRRMLFLGNNEIDIGNLHKISLFMKDKNSCPYCGLDLNDSTTFCNICGYNLEYEGDEDEEVITEDEAKEVLSDILESMSKMDKETADILLNPEENILYYQDGNKIINYNDPSDMLEFDDDDDFDDESDDDDELCYRLDESHKCMWDTYELCLYQSLEDFYYYADNIEDIISENAKEYERNDTGKIFDELVDKGFISKYLIPEYWENTVQDLKKKDLEDILRKNNLKISGNKKELTERIKENVNLEEIEFNSIESFKNYDYTIYLITPKGVEYLKSHEYNKLFDFPLNEYHYCEYRKFIEDKDDLLEATIEFLELHIKKALEDEDQFDYTTHIRNQNYVYHHFKDDENYFRGLVRLFIAKLNPIDTEYIFFYCDELIEENTLNKIRELYNKNDYDVEAVIVKEYSNLEHITVPLNALIENLPTLLSKTSPKKLDKKWRKTYINHNVADWD